MKLGRLVLGLLAPMCLASPAAAGSSPYFSMWFVEPTPAMAEVAVKRGDFVVRTRLLPPGLIELAEDVVEPGKGKLLARAGDQLFQVTAGRPMRETPAIDLGVYCSFHPEDIGPKGLLAVVGGRKLVYRCFVDTDHDGQLDGTVPVGCLAPTVFTIKGKVPAKPGPMTGGAYRKVAPEAIKDGPGIGIIFKGIRRDGAPELDLVFEDGEVIPSFLSPDGKTGVKGQRQILGAMVSVIDGTDAAAHLRVDAGFPVQPFIMISTGC